MAKQYRCDDCGSTFFAPNVRTWYENHGEGVRERWTALICPECGSEEVDEYDGEEDDAEALAF